MPARTHATIHEIRADQPEATALIAELDAELTLLYPGFPVHGLYPGEESDPKFRFWVMREGAQPIGCGALRRLTPDAAELKRMFVQRAHRRRGLARLLLQWIEARAREDGVQFLRLETGDGQPEAEALYRTAGYTDIPPFAKYIDHPGSICLEKRL